MASRLWLAPAAQENFARLLRAMRREGLRVPDWPLRAAAEIYIAPSNHTEGGLFIFVGGTRLHVPPGDWRLEDT